MHVLVYHTITDAKKWDQVTQNMKTKLEQGQLPEGLKARLFLPGVDGKKYTLQSFEKSKELEREGER